MEKEMGRFSKMGRFTWFYLKYQMLTKGLLLLAISPLSSGIMKALIQSTGRSNISSGDFFGFVLSFQGAGATVLGIFTMVILIGLDVNAFIIMSAVIHEGKGKITARELLVAGLKSLRVFLSPMGFLVMAYITLIIPIVGIGITISPMESFRIPNFIQDVIFNNNLYMILYSIFLIILVYISVRYIFLLHYTLLLKNKIGEALRNSARLFKKNWKNLIWNFFIKGFFIVLSGVFVIVATTILFALAGVFLSSNLTMERIILISGMLITAEITVFLSIMTVPIFCHRLTNLFYKYNEKEGNNIEAKLDLTPKGDKFYRGKLNKNTKISLVVAIIGVFIANTGFSLYYGINFDEIFRNYKKIDIIAHRGGGDLAAENSIKSLEKAIEKGVKWSEIDVQRTLDGFYIINHDKNFLRVAGEKRMSSEMTLEEIKQLNIKDLFDESRESQKVATLEEFMDTAKGRIGLYIELKGETADEKMVDDVVRMINEKDMIDETAILSLDYELIKYTEEKYPDIKTGFLYFFVMGDVANLKGDILIMEEREAEDWKIDEIHQAGKKAVVWTVNTEDSINRFVKSGVDGIITDYVTKVQEGMQYREEKTDFELASEYFMG